MCGSCEGLLRVWTSVRVDLASRDCEGRVRTAEQVQGCRWPPKVVAATLSPGLLSSSGWEQTLGTRARPALTRSEGSLLSPSELQASGLSLDWAPRRFPRGNEQNYLESMCSTLGRRLSLSGSFKSTLSSPSWFFSNFVYLKGFINNVGGSFLGFNI